MKSKICLFFLMVALTIQSCKSSKEVKASSVKTPVMLSQMISVSFISVASGIDRVAFDDFIKSIEKYEKENNYKLIFQIVTWGREGERDICFSPQPAPNFEGFIKQSEHKFSGNKLVQIQRDKPCKEQH